MRRAFGWVVLAILALACLPATGQERRTVPVTVLDKDGNIVEGLTAVNFRGEFRRRNVQMDSVMEERNSQPFAVVLDTSASMGATWLGHTDPPVNYSWIAARDALVSLRESLGSPGWFYTVGDDIRRYEVPEGGREDLNRFFAETFGAPGRTRGQSRLLDSIESIIAEIEFDGPGGTVYMITDGGDVENRKRRYALWDRLLRQGIRLFFLCFDQDILTQRKVPPTPPSICPDWAEATGGLSRRAQTDRLPKPKEDSVLAISRHLYPTMISFYRIEFTLPGALKKRRKWKLEVVDENGRKMKGVTVHYPRYLVPLDQPPD